MEEIKECPFCGSDAEVIIEGNTMGIGAFVQCKGCKNKGMLFSEFDWVGHAGTFNKERSKEKAIEFWNRRSEKKTIRGVYQDD